jgi:hypothetical protein
MDDDIFRDRRIGERRLAEDISDKVICRRIHSERRSLTLSHDCWQWWLNVNYVEPDNRIPGKQQEQ